MIRQDINIDDKWKVIVYYNINYELFDNIVSDVFDGGSPVEEIDELHHTMITHKAKAFTISNYHKRLSVVGFNKHKSALDYINSIVHEAEHVKQHILKYYRVRDEGEPPAYTVGYIVMKMMEVFKMMM